ncbi:carbonic anhydrase 14 [Brachyhypopomus gauderio]|uniref:carbonic anhydrase 14 n=1 Tax=Brachyhypopomus gauderio TaxID=698409 RepID=UPI004042BFAF
MERETTHQAWLGTTACILLCLCTGPTGAEWAYAGHGGQSEWPSLFPECGGPSQSPVDVVTTQTRHEPSLITPQLLGYHQHRDTPFTLTNNGHTVEMSLPNWMGVAGLPWQFSAVQLHLHWGNGMNMAVGSEHTTDGQSASAELHVVHYNSELYANTSEAKSQENGLAVLAVLIEAGEEMNQAYDNILNHLDLIRHAGLSVAIPAFDVQALLPADLSRYFRYNGSLTTPPCHQSVLWTIFSERVKVSHSQLIMLETVLFSSKADEIQPTMLQNNYRSTQPLNHRVVLSSFIPGPVKIYTAGEIFAILLGCLCGCVGMAMIVHFIVKTFRAKDVTKDLKKDVTLHTTSDPGATEEATPQSEP